MFRKIRRFKQEVSKEECVQILMTEKRGVLSVIGDNGYPYAIPMNFYYDKENNKIYLHGAKTGHKIDSIKKCDKICFTVRNNGFQKENDWAYYVTSVIIFGRAEFVYDPDLSYKELKKIGLKYAPTEEEVNKEISLYFDKVQLIQINIEHMTGKLVHEK